MILHQGRMHEKDMLAKTLLEAKTPTLPSLIQDWPFLPALPSFMQFYTLLQRPFFHFSAPKQLFAPQEKLLRLQERYVQN